MLHAGALTIDWLDGRQEIFGAPQGASGGGLDRMAFPFDWHQAQIEEFVDAVEAGRDPVSNGRTALRVHHLIETLIASARQGRQLPVTATNP